ncbi:MAG: phosphate ABC transporter permease subunit PstC [Rhodobacteraceae bacterium]|jgi:phosphate transport system permease protein|nr:phosphate ABC transporter permease subunit PstC [Paracoccaceae bacterium]
MPVHILCLILLAIGLAGYFLGRRRALQVAGGNAKLLHSLPAYHGWHVALMATVPALLLLALWLIVQPIYLENRVTGHLPPEMAATPADVSLAMSDIRRLAAGLETAVDAGVLTEEEVRDPAADPAALAATLKPLGVALGTTPTPQVLAAAREYRTTAARLSVARAAAVLAVALIGLIAALRMARVDLWARNRVERAVLGLLILASSVAILTTIGIVWSMLSESLRFFQHYPMADFFFGLTWSPNFKGGSELGFLPLLWGTMYITVIALAVAVPLGLYAAIYLAEYADPRLRAWIKPMIEVIAGIPTVVYGLFALITVGPFLRDYFAQPLGLGNSGSSVLNAGIVIGILNVPFISSLADDIINAVPQSLRDGSLGLGATRSETIRKVVLPAALPGIMGAVLMAASRAIGETMIVVMGAGAAAKLSLNPLEAMTTMTVKIVGQLTGDTDFAAPETLVAFALGMTLFAITLALNVLAVWIVRKYREQYE